MSKGILPYLVARLCALPGLRRRETDCKTGVSGETEKAAWPFDVAFTYGLTFDHNIYIYTSNL